MNLDSLNKWLTLLANIGVIAGIAFLAIEINQNNKQLEIQSYQNWSNSAINLNMSLTDRELSAIYASGVEDSRNLDEDSFISFAMWNMGIMQMAQTTDYLYRQGSIDRALWETEINRAAGILSLPGVRQWWNAGGRTQLSPDFVSLIESVEPDMSTWAWEEGKGFVTYEVPQ